MKRYFRPAEEGYAVREPDLVRWAEWWAANTKRRILAHELVGDRPLVYVETIFRSVDDGLTDPPMLWETRVTGGLHDGG